MKRQTWLAAIACSLAASTAAADDAPGVVKLADLRPAVRGQSYEGDIAPPLPPAEGMAYDAEMPGQAVPDSVVEGGEWPQGYFAGGAGTCDAGGCTDGSCGCGCGDGSCGCGDGSCGNGRTKHVSGWLKGQSSIHQDRNRRSSQRLAGFMRSKFGYFCPTGNNGRGVPLYGKYHMVYAQNPGHVDQRDGYSFAAPGYGTPVSVPLAPNVRHTMNYGWGVPSSRLTPLRQATVVGPPVDPVHGPRWK